MNTLIFFFLGVLLALVFSLLTIATIRTSLREILVELCGTTLRANYWLKMSEACLVLIAAFAALTFHSYESAKSPDFIDLVWILSRQLSFTLAMILISLIVISLVMVISLPHRRVTGDAKAG